MTAPVPIPAGLERFATLMARFAAETDELVEQWDAGGAERQRVALVLLGRLRVTAREARTFVPELARAGAVMGPVDARLQAVDLAIDRFLGSLGRDYQEEASLLSAIADHAAFLAVLATHLTPDAGA